MKTPQQRLPPIEIQVASLSSAAHRIHDLSTPLFEDELRAAQNEVFAAQTHLNLAIKQLELTHASISREVTAEHV